MPSYTHICFDPIEFEKVYRFVDGRYRFVCVRHLKDVIRRATLKNGKWELNPPTKAQDYQDILRDEDHRQLQIDGLIPEGGKYTLLISTGNGWSHSYSDKRALEIINELREGFPDIFSDARKNLMWLTDKEER